MSHAQTRIDEIRDLAGTITSTTASPARTALLSEIEALLDQVRRSTSLTSYGKEKISEIRFHVSAALGAESAEGHSVSQHVVWAYGALDSLETCVD